MNPSTRRPCLHVWVPDLSGIGGIQHYSRMLVRALEELRPETDLQIFSKNGRETPRATSYLEDRSTGATPRRLRTAHFAALLIQQTLKRRPDLVILTHLHFTPVAYLLKKLIGLRYWIVVHGIEAWNRKSLLLKQALAGAEKILPVSRYTELRLRQTQDLDPSCCTLLPNTVDGQAFFPSPKPKHLLRRYGLRPEQKIIFSLARLEAREWYKGHDLLLEALLRVREHLPDFHYLLAGGGNDGERLRRKVRDMGLKRHVTLTGALPARDLRDHYALCDLFALPSCGEGFGVVYLEALACGRPVLAGDQGRFP